VKIVTIASIAVLGLSGAAACASSGTRASSNLFAESSAPTVTVQNDNWLDVVVYVLRGASRFRIGTVRAASSETFSLRSEDSGGARPLQLLADPIGSDRGYVTDPIVLGPGQQLELRVGSAINTSTFSIRNR